jgi:ABC transporter
VTPRALTPQDDVLPATSTVSEHLEFHAALRMHAAHPAARRARIRAVIEQLALGRVGHSLIGDALLRGISGGEKRRVSIAAELLTAPPLLFLDEATTGAHPCGHQLAMRWECVSTHPTTLPGHASEYTPDRVTRPDHLAAPPREPRARARAARAGLDSTNAAHVVETLAALTGAGVNMLLTIHQPRPDVLRLMSRVLLLSPNGRLLFSGPVGRIEAHLAALGHSAPRGMLNVADWLLDVTLAAPPSELAKMAAAFESSALAIGEREAVAALRNAPALAAGAGTLRGKGYAPFGVQLRVLSAAQLRSTYRHPFVVATAWLSALAVAIGLGIAFANLTFDTQARC